MFVLKGLSFVWLYYSRSTWLIIMARLELDNKPNIIQFGWLLSALLIVILCAIIDNQGKLWDTDWCRSFIYYLQPRRRMNDPSRTCSFVHEKMLTKTTPARGRKDWLTGGLWLFRLSRNVWDEKYTNKLEWRVRWTWICFTNCLETYPKICWVLLNRVKVLQAVDEWF